MTYASVKQLNYLIISIYNMRTSKNGKRVYLYSSFHFIKYIFLCIDISCAMVCCDCEQTEHPEIVLPIPSFKK